VAFACAPGRPPGPLTPASTPGPFVAGYHPWWALSPVAWSDYPFDLLDRLYVFAIEVGGDGGIQDPHGWPEAWDPLVHRARAAGVDVALTLTLHDPPTADPEAPAGSGAFETLFSDPTRSALLIDRVVERVVSSPEVGGLHLDLEVFRSVPPEARDGYTAFVVALDRRLAEAAPGVALSIFALATDPWDAYDERTLAAAVDYLVVQGYDLHHRRDSRAGPVAPTRGWGNLNLESVVARYRSLGVPPGKMVLGLPLYGYEWPVVDDAPGAATRGEGITVPLADPAGVLPEAPTARERVAEFGVRRDPETGVPWYAFRTDAGFVQGWFDDAESLAAKYRWARARGLAGVALFPLAYGDAEIWEGLRRSYRR
jgi:spore germination protein YaaH